MKKIYCLLGFTFILTISLFAQDEGLIVKRERLDRNKGIFLGLGPSLTLGKNIGDYSAGVNVEVGYLKRVNRVLSIGPSLSYLNFEYDPEKTGINNAFIAEIEDDNGDYWYDLGMVIDFTGGNLSIISASLNLKFNFVPVKDDSKISVYGFAKPFLSVVSRSAVKGIATLYGNDYSPDEWIFLDEVPWATSDPAWSEVGIEISDKLNSDTEVTGGIFIGPGIELFPAKKLSFYLQAAFGYTLPVTFVSTKSYEGNTFDVLTEEFPMTKKGFPSLNFQFGLSFNF